MKLRVIYIYSHFLRVSQSLNYNLIQLALENQKRIILNVNVTIRVCVKNNNSLTPWFVKGYHLHTYLIPLFYSWCHIKWTIS